VKVHEETLESPYFERHVGTVITESLTDNDLLCDLEGAEEVVLFTSRAKESILLVSIEGQLGFVMFELEVVQTFH